MPEPLASRGTRVGARLAGTRFGDVRWFEQIDSTNTYALAAARAGVPEGLVVVADEQRAGRGRLGRTWESRPGVSLLVSVLLRPSVSDLSRTTMATGVALAEAVDQVAGFAPDLKWPNDLLVGDRKLAGILAESDLGDPVGVVVGAGCNVSWGVMPDELSDLATSCDIESGRIIDREDLLVAMLLSLDGLIDADDLDDRYRARLATIGRRVRVERHADVVVGEAVGIGSAGELIVRDDRGREHAVTAGDVVHLRPA